MTKELTTIDTNKYSGIITKTTDVGFKTIDEKALQKISDFMPEINRATNMFAKTNSQTMASLMTLTMLESGPYRVLRQILAQIENKRAALKENLYKHEQKKIQREELLEKLKDPDIDEISRKRFELKITKIEYDLVDSTHYIEGAIKEIGAYQERYKEVCKNNDIPIGVWDEVAFEEGEIEHHIKCIFRNGIRDRMQGSHNMGTMEYMEQFGINPITAYALIDNYISNIKGCIVEGKGPDIQAHYEFFDQMYNIFKDEYKKAAKRIGLDNITQADFLMKESA